jgi:hypothetical protein
MQSTQIIEEGAIVIYAVKAASRFPDHIIYVFCVDPETQHTRFMGVIASLPFMMWIPPQILSKTCPILDLTVFDLTSFSG